MDIAWPLIEYVAHGRMMSEDEISQIIKAAIASEKYKADADRLAETLRQQIQLVEYIAQPGYVALDIADIARAVLKAHEEANNE